MSETHDLVTRLEKLEKQNRRLVRSGRILLGLGAAGLVMSMAAPVCKTVWGERFVLKDGSKRERLVLDAYSSQNPSMTLKNRAGQRVAELALSEDGEMTMAIFQKGQKVGAHFELVPSETDEDKSVD